MSHFDGDISVNAVSKMAKLWILIFAIFTSGEAGYLYPRPATPFELPAKVNVVQQQNTVVDTSDLHESTVSFSLPLEDYNYLKQHKAEYHTSPFNDPTAGNAKVAHSSQFQNAKLDSSIPQRIEVQSEIVTSNIDTIHEHTSIGNQHQQFVNKEHLEVAKNELPQTETLIYDNHNESPDETSIVNQLVSTLDSQTVVPSTVSQIENHYSNKAVRVHNNLEHHVTRHIYFHVPPPDLEEPPIVRIPEPPKKIYKIIFIKVPAQDTLNSAQIQQVLYNQIAPVEDKTLIYVLTKKPEQVTVLPQPRPTPSEHEVLFVKYKENRSIADSPAISDMLEKRSVPNKDTDLQSSRVNGQR